MSLLQFGHPLPAKILSMAAGDNRSEKLGRETAGIEEAPSLRSVGMTTTGQSGRERLAVGPIKIE
jgi:hypothetical protein